MNGWKGDLAEILDGLGLSSMRLRSSSSTSWSMALRLDEDEEVTKSSSISMSASKDDCRISEGDMPGPVKDIRRSTGDRVAGLTSMVGGAGLFDSNLSVDKCETAIPTWSALCDGTDWEGGYCCPNHSCASCWLGARLGTGTGADPS